MSEKEKALQQIDDIYTIVHNHMRGFMSGVYMIAVGFGILAIPVFELIFQKLIDPLISTYLQSSAYIPIFMGRTIFYWMLFMAIALKFRREKNNPSMDKLFSVGRALPLIGVSFSAALAYVGYTDIIAPLILVLVGIFFLFYAEFTSFIVRIAAMSLIVGGIGSVLLVPYVIHNLWAYLVAYEGIVFIAMGVGLCIMKKDHVD